MQRLPRPSRLERNANAKRLDFSMPRATRSFAWFVSHCASLIVPHCASLTLPVSVHRSLCVCRYVPLIVCLSLCVHCATGLLQRLKECVIRPMPPLVCMCQLRRIVGRLSNLPNENCFAHSGTLQAPVVSLVHRFLSLPLLRFLSSLSSLSSPASLPSLFR